MRATVLVIAFLALTAVSCGTGAQENRTGGPSATSAAPSSGKTVIDGDELFVPEGASSLDEIVVVEPVGKGGETCQVQASLGPDGKVQVTAVSKDCEGMGLKGSVLNSSLLTPDELQHKKGRTYYCKCVKE
jgi:hypothetical protein